MFVSSEAFSLADDATIDRILEQLPRERMHAIFTLRPFARLLSLVVAAVPQVRLGAALRAVARGGLQRTRRSARPARTSGTATTTQGSSARWAQRLGRDRVTVVVVDDSDRQFLFRAFEALLDLPTGILVPDADSRRATAR